MGSLLFLGSIALPFWLAYHVATSRFRARDRFDKSAPWGGNYRVVKITRNGGEVSWGVQERDRFGECFPMPWPQFRFEPQWGPYLAEYKTRQEAIDHASSRYAKEVSKIEDVSLGANNG